MTSMRIGATRRRRIQHITETAGLRMAALLPAAEELPEELSVYEKPAARAQAAERAGASPAGGPPSGGPLHAGLFAGDLPIGDFPAGGSLAGGEPAGTGPPRGRPDAAPVPPPGVPPVGPPDGPGEPPSDSLPTGPPGGSPAVVPAGAYPWAGAAHALDRRAVAGLLVLLLLAVGYGVQHFWLARPQSVDVPTVAVASVGPGTPLSGLAGPEAGGGPGTGAADSGTAAGAGASAPVVVDIGGRVHSPGLHTLPGGSRVADALRAAGGPLPGTDTRNLNLARVLTDGEQILVGEPGLQPAAGAATGPPPAGAPKQPVSLNRATLEQLDTLPGVGPTLAQRIIAFRTSHGGAFRSIDQLRQVSGIGERTYTEIKPLLTL
ncbi:helix-hairpin-helix domain-containing protein [Kitasatospora sp. NPDC058406]|uniref:helix-hairpin-helix domain-containing protein n=1 Tax=Kitasatospora sp. NPDC058406 TaxID=3346483 RepID=UPI003652AFC7